MHKPTSRGAIAHKQQQRRVRRRTNANAQNALMFSIPDRVRTSPQKLSSSSNSGLRCRLTDRPCHEAYLPEEVPSTASPRDRRGHHSRRCRCCLLRHLSSCRRRRRRRQSRCRIMPRPSASCHACCGWWRSPFHHRQWMITPPPIVRLVHLRFS